MEFISNKNNNIKAFSFIFVVLYFEYFFSRRGTHNHRFLSSAMSEVQSILSQRLVFGSDVVSHAPYVHFDIRARIFFVLLHPTAQSSVRFACALVMSTLSLTLI